MNANGNNFYWVTFTCHATSRLDTIGSWAILQYHTVSIITEKTLINRKMCTKYFLRKTLIMLENSRNQLSKLNKKPLQKVVRQNDRVKKDKILTEHPPGPWEEETLFFASSHRSSESVSQCFAAAESLNLNWLLHLKQSCGFSCFVFCRSSILRFSVRPTLHFTAPPSGRGSRLHSSSSFWRVNGCSLATFSRITDTFWSGMWKRRAAAGGLHQILPTIPTPYMRHHQNSSALDPPPPFYLLSLKCTSLLSTVETPTILQTHKKHIKKHCFQIKPKSSQLSGSKLLVAMMITMEKSCLLHQSINRSIKKIYIEILF